MSVTNPPLRSAIVRYYIREAIIPRSLPLQGMVSEKGESCFHNASNGRIEAFWSSIHGFSSKHIHITWADFMDRAPWGTQKYTVRCVLLKNGDPSSGATKI